jgi:hypothetical protein
MANRFATDLLRALDPVALARAVGPEPHDYQIALLRSRSKQIVLNWSRQAGKSSATSILPLHTALYTPKSLTLILSPSDRQSGLLLDKVYDHLYALGWQPKQDEKESARYIRLANGSEVWALPGKEGTIRGFSGVDLLVIDEASKVPDPLYYAVRPMLAASGGRIVLLSTPFGKRGFFFEVCERGGDAWEYYEVPVTMVPHIDPAFVAQERRELPPEWFGQEYECRFLEATGQVFSHELIESLFAGDVAPLFGAEEPAWSENLITSAPTL